MQQEYNVIIKEKRILFLIEKCSLPTSLFVIYKLIYPI